MFFDLPPDPKVWIHAKKFKSGEWVMTSTASKFVDISLQPTCLLDSGELDSSQGSDIFEALFFRILHF